jgi:hypothetical protein
MPANANDACCLYWVKYESCVDDPYTDGYIGLTKNFNSRSSSHRRRFPGAKIEVLFEGTRAQCQDEEKKYRPRNYVGWNRHSGGGRYRKTTNPHTNGQGDLFGDGSATA